MDRGVGAEGNGDVVKGDDIFDGVKAQAAAFGDVMQQVEHPALVLRLLVERDQQGGGAALAHQGLGQEQIQGVEEQGFHPARRAGAVLVENRMGEIDGATAAENCAIAGGVR